MWYVEEGNVLLVLYFEKGDVILWRGWNGNLERLVFDSLNCFCASWLQTDADLEIDELKEMYDKKIWTEKETEQKYSAENGILALSFLSRFYSHSEVTIYMQSSVTNIWISVLELLMHRYFEIAL